MKYCSDCGQQVTQKIPPDDNRLRFVCDVCDTVHYQNPRVVVGTLPVWQEQVLLCKRAIEPRLGCWTLPAGFLENGETSREGALRETLEEAAAQVENDALYRIYNIAHADQLHIFFRCNMVEPSYAPTAESTEVALFAFDDIPWGELAFPTVFAVLEDYIRECREGGNFAPAMADVTSDDWQKIFQAFTD